jgi:hypothetical protein
MKNYINDVGLSICPMIQIGQHKFLTGRKCYNQWFGYYDQHTGLMKKIKMAVRNG